MPNEIKFSLERLFTLSESEKYQKNPRKRSKKNFKYKRKFSLLFSLGVNRPLVPSITERNYFINLMKKYLPVQELMSKTEMVIPQMVTTLLHTVMMATVMVLTTLMVMLVIYRMSWMTETKNDGNTPG